MDIEPIRSSFAKAMVAFVAVKSIVLGITASLIDVPFLHALILVVVSAVVTGIFGIVIAMIQAKADERQHRRLDYVESRLEDVAGSVGANKRASDPIPDPDAHAPPASP